MAHLPTPPCEQHTLCKCCGGGASLYGVVDFHKSCEEARGKFLSLAGIPVYYYRCQKCEFIFTTAFDHFSIEDFRRDIYNESYVLVDPDYLEVRPHANAGVISRLFADNKPQAILDYGGGNGQLSDQLRIRGFPIVDTYDPFVPEFSAKPVRRYDCVVSFEVAEHSTDPLRTFTEMTELLSERGLILFSTLVLPKDIDQQRLNWWYAAPRNGHVSLFSRSSLQAIVQRLQFKVGSFSDNLHVLFREVPDFAKAFLPSS